MPIRRTGNGFIDKMNRHQDPDALPLLPGVAVLTADPEPETQEQETQEPGPEAGGLEIEASIVTRAEALGWQVLEHPDSPGDLQFKEKTDDWRLVATFQGDCPEQEALAYLDGYEYAGRVALEMAMAELVLAFEKKGIKDAFSSMMALRDSYLGRGSRL